MTSKAASILCYTTFIGQTTHRDSIEKSTFLVFRFNEKSPNMTKKSIVLRDATRQYLSAVLCCPLDLRGIRSDKRLICLLLAETDAILKF